MAKPRIIVNIFEVPPAPIPDFLVTVQQGLQQGTLDNAQSGSFQLANPNPLFAPVHFIGSELEYSATPIPTAGTIDRIEVRSGNSLVGRMIFDEEIDAGDFGSAFDDFRNGDLAALEPFFKVPTVYNGSSGDDAIIDWGTHSTLKGKKGDDFLNGLDGNDKIDAGGGADEAQGGVGKDRIDAGGGADLINGGAGKDKVKTGGGRDVVVIDQFGAAHADTIQDWSKKDRLQFDPLVFPMLDGLATFPKEYLAKGKAKEDDDFFIFKNAKLYVDFDANGEGRPELLVKVPGEAIFAASILIG